MTGETSKAVHRLVTLGDSLSQGFQTFAIYNTHICELDSESSGSLDRGRLDVYALVRWVVMLGLIALVPGRAPSNMCGTAWTRGEARRRGRAIE